MAIVLVTHDLAVIAEVCDNVAVMYAGRIVEFGSVDEVLESPRHPYTAALIGSAPSFHGGTGALDAIGGRPPDPERSRRDAGSPRAAGSCVRTVEERCTA